MFRDFEQARCYVDEHGIQMVDLKFCDLWGRWHHLTVPSSQFMPALMEGGIGFDGSAVGLKSVKAGDMVLVPDLSSGTMDPFWDMPTLSFICTTLEADTHDVFAHDPRNIAVRAEAYMRETGIADESRWGPEFEFYVFDDVAYQNEVNMEFRPPDASCNVYLALAAQLLAGLDGIQREIDPTAAGFGPIDANIFAWSDAQRAQILHLPGSLDEALRALEADHAFLLAGEVFSEELIEQWVAYKRGQEYYPVRNRPHPYEVSLYFDV